MIYSMLKRKMMLSCLTALFTVGCLFAAGCDTKKSGTETAKTALTEADYKGKEVVFVYDAAGHLTATLSKQAQLEYIGSLISGSVEQSDKAVTLELVTDVPEDAKVLYRYVFKNQKMNLYVYSNYQKIRLTDIPRLSSIVWDVTDAEYGKLLHPERI